MKTKKILATVLAVVLAMGLSTAAFAEKGSAPKLTVPNEQVIGVEVNRDAVHDAIANAKLNDTKNIRFYCADAGEFMVDMASNGEKADIVFMDPPRAGSDKAFLSSVVTLSPKKIVYISCNPETQARDLSFLVRNGYKVRKIQPVDMFPHTAHVETVALLVRNK